MNIFETERPVIVAAMIIGTLGGMIGPRQEELAVIATLNGTSYPWFTIIGISTPPSATVSDSAVPDMPANTIDASTFAYARPPVMCPTSLSAKSSSLSDIPPWFLFCCAGAGIIKAERKGIPMAKQTLGERAAAQIMDYITEHRLTAGDKLPTEAELAAQLGVGRNTLREALKSLASRNIVTIRQGAGCYLSEKQGVADDPLGFAMIEDRKRLTRELMQVRCMIEPEIAALAAQNAAPAEMAQLRAACEACEADILARRDFSATDQEFHAALARCTHNGVIARLIPTITEGVGNYAATVDKREYEQTLRSHRAILHAVEARRPCDARREMEFHLLYNQNRFEQKEKD